MSIDSISRSGINIFKKGKKPDQCIVEIRSQLTDSAERTIKKGSFVPRNSVNEEKAITDAKRGFGKLYGKTDSGR